MQWFSIKVGLSSTDGKTTLEEKTRSSIPKKKKEREENVVVPAVVLTHAEFEAANPMGTGARVVRGNDWDWSSAELQAQFGNVIGRGLTADHAWKVLWYVQPKCNRELLPAPPPPSH